MRMVRAGAFGVRRTETAPTGAQLPAAFGRAPVGSFGSYSESGGMGANLDRRHHRPVGLPVAIRPCAEESPADAPEFVNRGRFDGQHSPARYPTA